MGRFSGVGSARQTLGGCYFQPGDYVVRILKVHMVDKRNGGGTFFTIETEVIESNAIEGVKPNAVGTKPAQMIKMSLDSALGNINGFASGVTGTDPEDVTEEDVEFIVSDKNPLGVTEASPHGTLARVSARNREKKNSEGEFTNVTWTEYKVAGI